MATAATQASARSSRGFGQADTKGRVSLGKAFARALLIVEISNDGATVVLRRAEAIPAHEAWLFKNPEAADLVRRGLEDARARRLTEGPDLRSDDDLVERLED